MSKDRTPIPEPFDLALREFYRPEPDMKVYRRLVELGAEVGDPLAQYAMATWYLHGEPKVGIKKNLARAVVLLEACAPMLNRAAYDLAVCWSRGEGGLKKDPSAMFSLFERSAKLGSLAAVEEQARCLAAGTGTKRDTEAARFLWKRFSRWKRELRALGALRAPGRSARAGQASGRKPAAGKSRQDTKAGRRR